MICNQGFFYGAAVFAPVQPGYAPMPFQPYLVPAQSLYTSWEAFQPMQCYEESRSYKTVLCRNYAPGGSGDCPYRLACQYIHPSDGLLYKFCMADTPEFKAAKEQHQKEVQVLHAQKSLAPPQQFQLEVAINMKIRSFNVGHPNGPDYHDFHGMTTMGAVSYVHDIIHQVRSSGTKKAWLEVGRGNHSANGFPVVRTYLTNNPHLFSGCSFVPIQGNDGILELTVV